VTLSRLMNQPLTVQAMGGTTTDVYGDQVPGALGDPVAVLGYLEQVTTAEHLADRDTVVSSWQAFLPASTVIGHMDYITFQSQKFQVDGEPHQVWNPRTRAVVHIECKLVVVGG